LSRFSYIEDDVEDEQYNPNWFDDYKDMIHSNQEGEANKLGYVILKMPEYRHQPPKAIFLVEWWLGLHNWEYLDNNESMVAKKELQTRLPF